ncbi:MAG: hypothetical protein IID40_03690, partial [Planctomycetes bacterium]|nr:hypothetical protein [Planctomycetota bacterium]
MRLDCYQAMLFATAVLLMWCGHSHGAPLFVDDFEGDLSQWTGKNGGSHHGVIVADPLRPGNSVLSFDALENAGDVYSPDIVFAAGEPITISFEYLGLALPQSVPDDFGGFLGISDHNDGLVSIWLAATREDYAGSSDGLEEHLVDDDQWHSYSITIANPFPSFHIMLEDWIFSGGVPGDVFFDNIEVSSLPGTTVYMNDFENVAGPEWSLQQLDVSPSGRSFLGRFENDRTVTLSVGAGTPVLPNGLPPHDIATIEFSLYIIHSWDGALFGADLWSIGVQNGPLLLLTSFANPLNGTANNPQNFPGSYPDDLFPARTGADEVDTLGYWSVPPTNFGDSVYDLSFTFPHTGASLAFDFIADGVTGTPLPYGLGDESWGIDDVIVRVVASPGIDTLASCAYHCTSPGCPSNYMCLDLPQSGEGGVLPVEPRLYGGVGEHRLQIRLTGAAVSAVTVDASCTDGSTPVPTSLVEAVPGTLTVTFSPPLPNGECCELTLSGGATGTAVIQILEGDVNQSGIVNATDKNLVKGKIGRALDAENFVYDVNMTGTINATDKFLVKAK